MFFSNIVREWKLGIYCKKRNVIVQQKHILQYKDNINLKINHVPTSILVSLLVQLVHNFLPIDIFSGDKHFKIIFLANTHSDHAIHVIFHYTVFWEISLFRENWQFFLNLTHCNLIEIYRQFGSSTFRRNVLNVLSHPIRDKSAFSSPWQSRIQQYVHFPNIYEYIRSLTMMDSLYQYEPKYLKHFLPYP